MNRLNVGSGEFPAHGWTNIDIYPGNNPDRVADIRELPFPDQHFTDIYLGHVLEHIPRVDLPKALAEVRRAVTVDGRVCVVGPDLDRMTPGSDLHTTARRGGHRWPGDEHMWDSTAAATLEAVRAAGFNAREIPITSPLLDGWPVVSRIGWQFAILSV